MKTTHELIDASVDFIATGIFPLVDATEAMMTQGNDVPEFSLDVEMFLAFAVRLTHMGWPLELLHEMVNDSVIDYEKEDCVGGVC